MTSENKVKPSSAQRDYWLMLRIRLVKEELDGLDAKSISKDIQDLWQELRDDYGHSYREMTRIQRRNETRKIFRWIMRRENS